METRWRFLLGLAVASCLCASMVLLWPKAAALVPMVSSVDANSELGRQLRDAAAQLANYRSYIWSQWFGKNLRQMATLFGMLLGTGGLLSQSAGGAVLFTLSMPVSRRALLWTRAAAGLAEMAVLTIGVSLWIPLLSPAVGKHYEVDTTLINSGCLFVAATVFFSLTFLLSTVFTDIWRPMLITLVAAVAISVAEQFADGASRYLIFDPASPGGYSSIGELPWNALLMRAALSAVMLYAAVANLRRRDF